MTETLPRFDPARFIVLATRNPGKVREFATLLQRFNVTPLGLQEFPEMADVEETGATFAANALLKASYASRYTGLTAIADDSGIAVDALNGAPGIYSARYSLLDEHGTPTGTHPVSESIDQANNRKLLHVLHNTPADRRGATFHCVIAAVTPSGGSVTAHGEWCGTIAHTPSGSNGFGYDPLFVDPALGISAAALEPAVKNARSHRAKALEALAELWPHFWNKHLHDLPGDAQ